MLTSAIRRRSYYLWPVRLLPAASFCAASIFAQTQPTKSQPAQELDQVWQRASSKYDSQRNELLKAVRHGANEGPYRADWQSLQNYEVPDWYKDAKFGIFLHWGVYSVPAFGSEWYPRNMYRQGSEEYKHHLATYGPLTKFGYKDFIPMFRAEHFDPVAWARLFKEAGAKYVVPVFEHHDGFAMYDSGLSDWTVAKMGPRRDVQGELAKAVRAEGLHLGASSHRVEHNFFLDGGRQIESDVNDPQFAAFYGPAHSWMESKQTLLTDWTYVSDAYLDDWLARDAEIVTKYRPDIFYFDWWIGQPAVRKHLMEFAAFYYNESAARGSVGVINYKLDAMEKHSGVLDVERGQLNDIRPLYWQTDTSISNKSWGFIEHDSFKSAQTIVHQLVDIVSKNGNLLVNIGPRADGTIPEEVQNVLREVGSWLKMNGEAIYGTRPWKVYGEGPTKIVEGAFHDTDAQPFTGRDFRFTTKNGVLYATELGWPANGEAVIHSLAESASEDRKITGVSLLGSAAALTFAQQPDGLHIQAPVQPAGKYAHCFRITFGPASL
ncbi:MAG TPA: alpha-L-fucosidase [Candidatus Acidoferrum sp.]|nr:alpha-L-fucosidase [Candidatus Acidoferrum sp.]